MADWAYDQMLEEEMSILNSYLEYMEMSDSDLIHHVEHTLLDKYYTEDDFTPIVIDIYFAHLSGYVLSYKQKRLLANHLSRHELEL